MHNKNVSTRQQAQQHVQTFSQSQRNTHSLRAHVVLHMPTCTHAALYTFTVELLHKRKHGGGQKARSRYMWWMKNNFLGEKLRREAHEKKRDREGMEERGGKE